LSHGVSALPADGLDLMPHRKLDYFGPDANVPRYLLDRRRNESRRAVRRTIKNIALVCLVLLVALVGLLLLVSLGSPDFRGMH
jgi:hypothetical protein